MKSFIYIFWVVLIPFWLVTVVLPFFSVWFEIESVMQHNNDGTWTLYGFWNMDTDSSNAYYIFMVGSAFAMSILWKLEWIFSLKLKQKDRAKGKDLGTDSN